MAFILGLTGSFGSGKSTVSEIFRARGVPVIDADELARQAVEPGRPALAELAHAFGPDLLDEAGGLKRRELAARVFADRRALTRLNAILHPVVRAQTLALLARFAAAPLVVVDVPLLFESGMQRLVDRVAVVTITENQRFFRLKRRGFGEREVTSRLGMQMPQTRKIRLADFIIDNSGTIQATRKQVQTLMDHISREKLKEQ